MDSNKSIQKEILELIENTKKLNPDIIWSDDETKEFTIHIEKITNKDKQE